nr:MAG TPA: antitoxin [Caudoviricetes sp.]
MKKREQTTIRLPEELLERLKREADSKGYTVNAQILQILWEWVKKLN